MRDYSEEPLVDLEIPGQSKWEMEKGGLPYHPADLLEAAIEDMETTARLPGYTIHMSYWHNSTRDIRRSGDVKMGCVLCLAGCVMSRRLSVPVNQDFAPALFEDEPTRSRLLALDLFRFSEITTGILRMGFFYDDVSRHLRQDHTDLRRDSRAFQARHGSDPMPFGTLVFDQQIHLLRRTAGLVRSFNCYPVDAARAGVPV